MKLKALFDFPPWNKGEVFEIDDTVGAALMAAQFGHFEVIPEPKPEPTTVRAFDAPPADKMVRKQGRRK